MSDHVLRLVPKEIQFQPELASARSAQTLVRSFFPEAREVHFSYYDAVSFIDAGENWEGVRCPACGADAESWWGDSMSTAAEAEFASLATQAPCCGASVQLSELSYAWPVAFGRFVMEVLNPNATSLTPERSAKLSELLGCPLLTINARI